MRLNLQSQLKEVLVKVTSLQDDVAPALTGDRRLQARTVFSACPFELVVSWPDLLVPAHHG